MTLDVNLFLPEAEANLNVQLQSDLITSPFWNEVRRCLAEECRRRGIEGWSLILRPRTNADDEFSRDPAAYKLSEGEAEFLDRASPDLDVDRRARVATWVLPDGEDFRDPDTGRTMTAADLASEFADDFELMAE